MKNILKISLRSSLLALTLVCFLSCEDDDIDGMDTLSKSIATTSVSSLTVAEGKTEYIPFTIDNPVNTKSQFKIEVSSGGSAEEDVDFIAGTGDLRGDNGITGEGFEMEVPPYAASFDIPVSALLDFDQTEGTETFQLKISATGIRTVITPKVYTVDVTIVDYEYCLWNLDVMDAYGDSWQGATITFSDDTQTVVYPKEDWDDFDETYQVPLDSNGSFSITYTSGTTGDQPNQAGDPGYEEENSYVLTAPNGTVYSDGPIPTVGTIVSGADACN